MSEASSTPCSTSKTSALEPLERWAHDEIDLPDTYPFGV